MYDVALGKLGWRSWRRSIHPSNVYGEQLDATVVRSRHFSDVAIAHPSSVHDERLDATAVHSRHLDDAVVAWAKYSEKVVAELGVEMCSEEVVAELGAEIASVVARALFRGGGCRTRGRNCGHGHKGIVGKSHGEAVHASMRWFRSS